MNYMSFIATFLNGGRFFFVPVLFLGDIFMGYAL
ncbi:hypothetical protein CALK_1028 [Chitinivibrio alkaliphilus ACht1]|uniref:Uncharacterized protein n=1 Tax=Chitinivibrio alkaliphilus ACht1 TaxID=1313304 RepID=U7D8Y4_9BACT|nr:hypothetical protein CALK_1028 [Chitinivibrio alkaliphilus ACht1]